MKRIPLIWQDFEPFSSIDKAKSPFYTFLWFLFSFNILDGEA